MALSSDELRELDVLAGGDAVHQTTDTDAIDGVTPAAVVEPAAPEGVAAVLKWCSSHRRPVVIRGGGSNMGWGRPPAEVDVLLSARRLAGISRYEPGDLTVTVGAGTAIEDLNQELAAHRQWLPIDTRSSRSTIGGAIATNDSGPLRHRYGAPRDQLIGIRLATADGRLASAGGIVVKNVAGYDLGKLVAGSFGSLAAIVSATFKLAPSPAATRTLVASFRDRADLSGAAAEISASQLDPMSVEVEANTPERGEGRRPTLHLLVRFAGASAVVEEQIVAAERLIAAFGAVDLDRMSDEADRALWAHRARRTWSLSGAVLKLSWMPAVLADVVALVEEIRSASGAEIELVGRAALGVGLVRVSGEQTAEIAAVERFRSRPSVVGHVVVVRGGAELKSRVDVWGVPQGTSLVTRLVKQALDPAGVLNAARGPA